MKHIVTSYSFSTGKLADPLRFLIVSDLHNGPWEDILSHLEGVDALLIPGDMADRYRNIYQNSLLFLRECTKRLPVFMSFGNHDEAVSPFRPYINKLLDIGVHLLCEDYAVFKGVAIAGRYIPKEKHSAYHLLKAGPKRITEFESLSLPKILLCHKPEQYKRLGKNHPVDLVIAGHAHGGQVRIFGHGLYSPGQGFLPRYIHGMEESNLLVTSGAGNPVRMPRWGNPCEIVLLTFS